MIKLSRIFHYKLTVHIAVLQPHKCRNIYGLGYSHFARRYWGNHFCFIFLWLLRCFSSPGLLLSMTSLQLAGFPHSEICGLKDICSYPQLIAAYYVLHRLWEPRHPPYALNCFLISNNLLCTFMIINIEIRQRTSTHLSLVENIGVEPMTSCVQGRRSSQLS